MTDGDISVNGTESRAKLRRRIEHLEEVLREHPSKWSFDTLLWVGRRLLAEHYPADIFTGASGDPGPEYVVALRAALARCETT